MHTRTRIYLKLVLLKVNLRYHKNIALIKLDCKQKVVRATMAHWLMKLATKLSPSYIRCYDDFIINRAWHEMEANLYDSCKVG
jgi:hypothetical protein